MNKSDIAYITAPLRGSAFLAAALEQADVRRCDRCRIEIGLGALCRRCGRFEPSERELIEMVKR